MKSSFFAYFLPTRYNGGSKRSFIMRTVLLPLEVFEGARELGVSLKDLLLGEVAGLARGERLNARRKRDLHVRLDAGLAYKVAIGGEPLGDAEQDSRSVPEDELREHRPRTEGGLPDHGGSVVVAQGAGQDLRARGRPSVHQDRNRDTRGVSATIYYLDLLALARGVLADVDDATRLQEAPCHLDHLVQPAPRVVPEVKDKALGAGGTRLLEGLMELLGAVVREGGQAHLRHVALRDEPPRGHGRLDLGALEVEDALLASARDGELDLGALRPLDLIDDVPHVLAAHALTVHGDHDVAGLDPSPPRGRAFYRGDDDHLAVLLVKLDPDPDVRPGEAFAVVLALLGGQKARVPLVP